MITFVFILSVMISFALGTHFGAGRMNKFMCNLFAEILHDIALGYDSDKRAEFIKTTRHILRSKVVKATIELNNVHNS